RHHIIDYHHAFAACAVLVSKETSAQQWNTHYVQVIRSNAVGKDKPLFVFWRLGRGGVVGNLIIAFPHGHGIHHGNCLNPRYGSCIVKSLLPGSASLRWISQGTWRKRHAAGQHIVNVEARIERRESQESAAQ